MKQKITKIVLLIVCLIGIIFSIIKIYTWYKENKQNDDLKDEVEQAVTDEEEISIDFNELQNQNKDTVAWIKVYGTDIEYPIVQTTDNNYYLKHSFDKTENSAGWIFLDYRNTLDGTDKNIIVYGHNRQDRSMFGSLDKVLETSWQEENNTILFYTPDSKNTYQVFSVYQIETETYYLTTDFTNEEYQEFINTLKERSEYDFDIEVTTDDTILTLSTCGSTSNYRTVLHAKKID